MQERRRNAKVSPWLIRIAGATRRLIRSRKAGCEAISSPNSMLATRASTSAGSARKFGRISSRPSCPAVFSRRSPRLWGRTRAGTMPKLLGGIGYWAAISSETKDASGNKRTTWRMGIG